MNFDRIAPIYHFLESLVFGDQLQQARVAFVRRIDAPRHALLLGEGNGRFMAELIRRHPGTRIDCVEASARMIALAQERVGPGRVRFLHTDLRGATLPENRYDLVVTHFFLDCFSPAELRQVIQKLSRAASAEAVWLVADFCEPARGWRRWRARILIAVMYAFFRAAAGISARSLTQYAVPMEEEDFSLTSELLLPNEMIKSQMWRRSPTPSVQNFSSGLEQGG